MPASKLVNDILNGTMQDEAVKKLQAQAMADIQRFIAKAEAGQDPYRVERQILAMELVAARHRKKVSQGQLAAQLGMQQSAISRIESGRSNPSLN
ncbi:MAG TPA: helix-turn-helix transcriptional regulator, partial [Candidatus Saccharimonadales bacterium]|nr:helix-turn-helix transcriptional regulator [Candidatus Saccharimonadales bacterium]